jgi:hypothetical protein
MEQDKVLERVRKLIALAETPGTPDAEADSARAKADQLMLDYAIEQADLDATRPASQRSEPEILKIDLIRGNSPVRREIVSIAGHIADHCRCKVVIHGYFEDVNDSSVFDTFKVRATVIGYASDLRYFELLFTVVQLHFSGAVDPRPDTTLSFDEQCYRFHEAGITYRKMVHMLFPDELSRWSTEKEVRKLGGRCKSAYKRECKKRGEEPRAIPNPDIYQRSFAKSYSHRIFWRLQSMQGSRSGGTTTALVRRIETVDEKMAEMFPDLSPLETEATVKADRAGMLAGDEAAQKVDLAGQGMGSGNANRPSLS